MRKPNRFLRGKKPLRKKFYRRAAVVALAAGIAVPFLMKGKPAELQRIPLRERPPITHTIKIPPVKTYWFDLNVKNSMNVLNNSTAKQLFDGTAQFPTAFINSLSKIESSFNPKAVSPKGAKGETQLSGSALKRLKEAGFKVDPFNKEQCIAGTKALLKMDLNDLKRNNFLFNGKKLSFQVLPSELQLRLLLEVYNRGATAFFRDYRLFEKISRKDPKADIENFLRISGKFSGKVIREIKHYSGM